MSILSKHATDTGKPVQMMLIPKDNIKPLDQKPYTLPLEHHTWLRKEWMDLEKAGIISPSTSHFASSSIIIPEKKGQCTVKHLQNGG